MKGKSGLGYPSGQPAHLESNFKLRRVSKVFSLLGKYDGISVMGFGYSIKPSIFITNKRSLALLSSQVINSPPRIVKACVLIRFKSIVSFLKFCTLARVKKGCGKFLSIDSDLEPSDLRTIGRIGNELGPLDDDILLKVERDKCRQCDRKLYRATKKKYSCVCSSKEIHKLGCTISSRTKKELLDSEICTCGRKRLMVCKTTIQQDVKELERKLAEDLVITVAKHGNSGLIKALENEIKQMRKDFPFYPRFNLNSFNGVPRNVREYNEKVRDKQKELDEMKMGT